MASAMQLYAAFALLMIAVIAIIVLAALVSNLIGAVRRQFGRTRAPRAHDDLSAPVQRSRSDSGASRTAPVSPSDNPPPPR
jgi:peptidoglycan/LPS O-acetylase OafA/YrhL